jgi:branched-chain amino acid transport system substrate-binding protein
MLFLGQDTKAAWKAAQNGREFPIQSHPTLNMKFFLTLLVPVLISASVGAQSIKIGEVDPLTGGISQFGIGCHQGITIAFEGVNAEGGVLGRKIELITEDDQSKPGQSATVVRKLITQDKVVAILGDATSSATLESAPIAQNNKIPMITPSATNPRITEVGDFIFRVCFLDEFQGRVIARFASKTRYDLCPGLLSGGRPHYQTRSPDRIEDAIHWLRWMGESSPARYWRQSR